MKNVESALKRALFEIDEIQFRLQCGIAVLERLQSTLEEGGFSGALFAVYDYLAGADEELRAEIDKGFQSIKIARESEQQEEKQ